MTDAALEAKFESFTSGPGARFAPDARVAWALARSLDYGHPGLTKAAYLAHPLRVAQSYVADAPSACAAGVALALSHNVLETAGSAAAPVLDKLDQRFTGVRRWVEALTIDRARQSDQTYLARYYGAIAQAGAPANEVKVLDKIDNLYLLCSNPDAAVRAAYLREIEAFVAPLADQCLPNRTSDLRALVDEARRIGYRPAARHD
ncbi:MAG: hypothetical protein AAF360_18770 [Pseudomonadota bacterium]